MKSNIAMVPENAILAGFNPIFTSDCWRFQKLKGTDVVIIQQGCFDLTAVSCGSFRFLDTPNNQTV
jgi:hypothetical protein